MTTEGSVLIVVPIKVWTLGLHGFRAKYLQSSRPMILPHLLILELSETDRFSGYETRRFADFIQGFSCDLLAFSYYISIVDWDEETQSLGLGPRNADGFKSIWKRVQKGLKLERNYRDKGYQPRLLLAGNFSKSQYELEDAFRLMNGDYFSISCRATEIESYRRQAGDWLLQESVTLQESKEN